MANDDHDLDDFDIDDGMDIPDFDDAGLDGSGGKKREPIERAAGGFLQGVKETSMKRSFQRKLIENSLPKGYGKAFDDVSDAVSLGQDLYDSTTSALRPYQRTIKKIGRRVSEKADAFLPDSLSKKLKELTEPDNDQADKIDPLESKITSELGEIFGAQMEQSAEERAANENRENIKEVVEEQRHNTSLDVLRTIRSGQDRLVAYQDKITAGYQRKSLEYQIRQLSVSRRQYELLEGHVKESKVQLDSVVKNTALPEFVKLRGSEAAKQIMRQRLLGNMTQGLQDRLSGAGDRFKENITKRVASFNKSLVEGIQGAGDAMEMTEGLDIDGFDAAGNMVGSTALGEAVSPIGRKLGGYLRKVPGVDRVGDSLEFGSDNKEEIIRRYLKTQTQGIEERDPDAPDDRSNVDKIKDVWANGTQGIRAGGARFLLDLMGPEYSPERTLGGQSSIDAAQEVVPYTSMTDRAITEIIPDILTNILHETEMIRTGDDNLDRRVYDVDRRTMRREDVVQKEIMERVMPEKTKEGIREDLDTFITKLDEQGSLSDSARSSFKRQLLQDMMAGNKFIPERYVESGGLATVESDSDSEDIKSLIRARFLDEDDKVRDTDQVKLDRNALSKEYASTSSTMPDYQSVVTEINALYGPEMLRTMGLIAPEAGYATSDKIETKSILDNVMSNQGFTNRGLGAGPVARLTPTPPPTPEPTPEPIVDPMERINRLVQDTSPIPDYVPEASSELTTIMSRVATSVDRLVSRFTDFSITPITEYLDLLSDQSRNSEEYLDLLVDKVSALVDVRKSASNKDQFEHVLTAIADIDSNDAVDISNDWLKKIYDLMLKCCGPKGDGPGPSGGGPTNNGPTGGGRPFRPLSNVPTLLAVPEWLKSPPSLDPSLLDPAKKVFGKIKDTATESYAKARDTDYVGKSKELLDDIKDVDFGAAKDTAIERLAPIGTQAKDRLAPLGAQIKDRLSPVTKTIGRGVDVVKADARVQQVTDKVGAAGTSVREAMAGLDVEGQIRNLTGLSLSDLDPDVLYEKVHDVLDYDYAGKANTAVEALKGLSRDDLIALVTQFDHEQVMGSVKSTATDVASATRTRVEGALGQLKDRATTAKSTVRDVASQARTRADGTLGDLKEQITAAKETGKNGLADVTSKMVGASERAMESVKRRGAQLKVPDNVIDFGAFKLSDQPIMQSFDGEGMKRAVGDGLNRFTDTVSSRASTIGSQVGSQYDSLRESTTGSLEEIVSLFKDSNFGKVGDVEDEAANDPKILLSMLQRQARKTLEALQKADVSSEVNTFVEDLQGKSKSILSGIQGAIRKTMDSRQSDGVEQTLGQTPGDGFWSEAWEMLSEIKGHMDRKTEDLIGAIQNISLLGGEGTGENKPGAFRRLGGKAADGLGGVLSYYGSALRTGGNLMAGASKTARGGLEGLGGLLKGGGKGLGKLLGGKDTIVDIYLEGQEEPVMLARDLKKGRYINREGGKEVKRLGDIEGDVVDVESGNLVVTETDVREKKLYVKGGTKSEGSVLKNLAGKAFNYSTLGARLGGTVVSKVFSAGKDYLDRPQDIYVKGEEKPKLLAVVLKSGGYFSAATGEPIYSIKDIDGAVKNRDGNIVLTEDDIREGLVNARGKAIRTGISAGASAVGSVVSGVAGFYKGAFEMGKGALQKTMGFFGGGDGGGGGLFGGSKKQIEWLEKIYTLLDTRIEVPESVRQGSWQQMMGKSTDGSVAANDASGGNDAVDKKGGKGLFGMLGAGGILDKLNPFSGDGFGSSAAGAAAGSAAEGMFDGETRKERKARQRANRARPGKKGFMGKLWQGTKKLGRGAMKLGKWAIPAATSLLPSGAAIASTASAIGGGLATAAGAVGSVLTAPVVLTGAAIAAVGVGAYLLYKHFSDRPDGPIHRFRLAQYGIDPESKDHVAKLNALEDKLSGELQYRKGQSPTLSDNIDTDELVQITGVDPEDANAVQNWALWFQRRFKPVFFSHMAVANEIDSGMKPSDIDSSVDRVKKAEFIKRVHFKDGGNDVYGQLMSPFPDMDELLGAGHVQSTYDSVLKKVTVDVKKPAYVGRTMSRPENFGKAPEPETIVDVAPKKPKSAEAQLRETQAREYNSKTVDDLLGSTSIEDMVPKSANVTDMMRAGVLKRTVQSPTNQFGAAEKEASESVASQKKVAYDPFVGLENEAFDPMDHYRLQVARKAAYERRGLPTDHIKIPTITRLDDQKSPEVPQAPKPKVTVPTVKSTRMWGQAMDLASTSESAEDEQLVEERKRKESRVVKQTETQTASNTSQMNTTMNRMVNILSDSHGVQKEIRDTLGTMNRMFKERYENDGQKDNRGELVGASGKGTAGSSSVGTSGPSRPEKKIRPLSTGR